MIRAGISTRAKMPTIAAERVISGMGFKANFLPGPPSPFSPL